ncbi:unnamed protein product [Cuscuta europaea]|uniref:Reverse transcriptase domain-containing protein n=1 Tax=Cuscuta europaea TaxID=41803 RepID=A0A9P0VMH2_CUSEU|nr:unnamed protein product [Cuscuta europaea]
MLYLILGMTRPRGLDGFSSAFFKENWSIVGDDVIEAVRGFFESGRLVEQINHTLIALIPKTSHSPTASDFRPIACTNVLYKVITKVIANRMIPCLPGLIDHAQGAFVDVRLMMDNIFLAQELVKGYTRKHCSPRCMIKVDLRKAYGTISLDFLKSVLLNIGFPLQFVKWIMECVATASFSISINGTLHGFFRGKRGLRQGTIWNKVRAWIGMPRQMSTLDSAVKWIKKDRAGVWIKAKTIRIAFIYTIYWIWRVRNATRFDDKKTREEEVFERIQYMVYKILYTPFIPL